MERSAAPRESQSKSVVKVEQGGAIVFVGIWGWLYTIGYLHLGFWQGLLAIVLWPFYLGSAFGAPH